MPLLTALNSLQQNKHIKHCYKKIITKPLSVFVLVVCCCISATSYGSAEKLFSASPPAPVIARGENGNATVLSHQSANLLDASDTPQEENKQKARHSWLFIYPKKSSYQRLLSIINNAHHSIKLATYSFTSAAIAQALINKAKQGIKVNIMIERRPYKEETVNNKMVKLLSHHKNISIKYKHFYHGYLHEKLLIIDHNTTAILTLNFTNSGLFYQRNFMYLTNSINTAKQIERLFNADWNNKAFHPKKNTTLVISPNNSDRKIRQLLAQTKTKTEVYADGLTDNAFITSLENIAQRANVQIILTKPNNMRIVKELCQHNIHLHFFSLKRYRQHAKAILINSDSAAPSAYIGSINFTYPSLHKNRELGTITQSKEVTQKLASAFNKDWDKNSVNACT